ncbi:hypothetical protein B296_00056713 [Ensete ventricosum]|uniref:Uncharacterized protein n=1 Tax=Ensete ventricosum TaxID=4639 RepID=A0A426XKB9_ENSVE|nr:hypothetical protein B296_00056713 [Ensete ventricosum]
MSSSGSSSIRIVPSASSEGMRSEGQETSVSGSSHSGIPSPEDTRSRRDLEVIKSCHDITSVISEEGLESIRECYSIPEGYVEGNPSPFSSNPGYDQEVVGRGQAQYSFLGDLCAMRVREDDEGYYVLQMVDWASKDLSATIQARWPNLTY